MVMVFFILLNYGDFLLTKIGCFRLTLFGDFLLTLTLAIQKAERPGVERQIKYT